MGPSYPLASRCLQCRPISTERLDLKFCFRHQQVPQRRAGMAVTWVLCWPGSYDRPPPAVTAAAPHTSSARWLAGHVAASGSPPWAEGVGPCDSAARGLLRALSWCV